VDTGKERGTGAGYEARRRELGKASLKTVDDGDQQADGIT